MSQHFYKLEWENKSHPDSKHFTWDEAIAKIRELTVDAEGHFTISGKVTNYYLYDNDRKPKMVAKITMH
jgi:hypothetical protein